MIKKFGKDRAVDPRWLNVPIKYMTEVKGSDTESKRREVPAETVEEAYNEYKAWCADMDWDDDMTLEQYRECVEKGEIALRMKSIPPKNDKDFCILELSKRQATCAWRNNQTCKVGMTFVCKVDEHKDGTVGIVYKDKFYPINKSTSGWVF